MKRIVPLTFLITAALTVAACGDSGKTLDTTQVEKDITQVASAGGAEAKAECPDEVKDIKKGTQYECTITYQGNDKNKQTVQMQVGDNDESEFVNQEAASDEAAIRSIVALTEKDPAAICDHLSQDVLDQLGGDDCAQQATDSDDGKPADIKSVKVNGDEATLVSSESTVSFGKDESGAWVITQVQ